MCLIIEEGREAKVATKDISCYKLLDKFDNDYKTFYQGTRIKLGETYLSQISKIVTNSLEMAIEEGLHSFSTLKDAKNFMQTRFRYYDIKGVIVRCIIPKGS
jgi:hypothetical protein